MRYCPHCGTPTELAACPRDGTPTVRRVATTTGDLGTGELIGGRYRVVGVLGRGGFGTVYDAVHATTGHSVALKVLVVQPGSEGEELARRFFKEAAATSRLSHPNTVRVFDFGQSDRGDLFLAMERLVGETLADRLAHLVAGGETMDEEDAVEIAVAVLRSLGEAHAHGLVHRDLKPANIFLHRVAGGEAVVKVLDFGIVKDVDVHMTQAGKALGTPTHMSPEQAMGKAVDGRTDLYALGVLLFECLTGALPYYNESPLATVMMHVTEPVPSVRARAARPLRPAVAAVVEQALAKDPEERWPDANAMRAALQRALKDTPAPLGAAAATSPLRTTPPPPPPPRQAPRAPAAAPAPAPSAPSSIRVRLPPRPSHASAQIRIDDGGDDDATAVGISAMPEEPETPPPLGDASPGATRPTTAAPPPASPPAPAAPAVAPPPPSLHQQPTVVLAAVEVAAPEAAAPTEPARSAAAPGDAPAPCPPIAEPDDDDAVLMVVGDEPTTAAAAAPRAEVAQAASLAEIEQPVAPERPSARPRSQPAAQRHPDDGPGAPAPDRFGDADGIRPRGLSGGRGPLGQTSPPGRPDFAALLGSVSARGMPDRMAHDLARMTGELRRRQQQGAATRRHLAAAMAFGDDGRCVVLGTRGGEVRLLHIEPASGHPLAIGDLDGVHLGDHDAAVVGVALLGDGDIVSAGLDRTLRRFGPRDGAEVASLTLEAAPTSLAAANDGKLIVVGMDDGGVALVEAADLSLRRVLRGHREAIGAVAVGSSRRSLLSASDDGSVRTWDPVGGGARVTMRSHGCRVGAVALRRDVLVAASGGWDGRLLLWSPRTGDILTDIQAHADVIAGLAFSSDGRLLASASDDRSVRIWDVESGRERGLRDGLDAGAKWVHFCDGDRQVIAGTWGGAVITLPAPPG